jgi:hypothetical protein
MDVGELPAKHHSTGCKNDTMLLRPFPHIWSLAEGRLQPILGGGIGKLATAVWIHLSPSSINITGISSLMGYFRPQSWHTSQ